MPSKKNKPLLKGYCKNSDINKFLWRENITAWKAREYVYVFKWYTHYVTIYTAKIEIYEDNFIKVKLKTQRNYFPAYTNTYYFDAKGMEIKAGTTRMECNIWKQKRMLNNE